MNKQKSGNEVLPPYVKSVSPGLSFTTDFGHTEPMTVQMEGDYRSPDFEITASNGVPLFDIETESTLIYHVSYVKDLRPNGPQGIAHTIKRKTDGDRWHYSARSVGKDGVQYLEIETTSKIISNASTKLVFRSTVDGELDAIYLRTELQRGRRTAVVEYQGKRIGEILQLGKDESPKFNLVIDVPRVDPLLFVCLACVLDDRLMTSRRRLRRPLLLGFLVSEKALVLVSLALMQLGEQSEFCPSRAAPTVQLIESGGPLCLDGWDRSNMLSWLATPRATLTAINFKGWIQITTFNKRESSVDSPGFPTRQD